MFLKIDFISHQIHIELNSDFGILLLNQKGERHYDFKN